MSILQLASKARDLGLSSPAIGLYRSILKELPRVITIYDLDVSVLDARSTLRKQFDKNSQIEDEAVQTMLIEKGYMELEETLLMWKQKAQIMRLFEGYTQEGQGHLRKNIGLSESQKKDFMTDFYRS
mmetsp:Transcript_11673/g.15234  ORF Transcript_11673/g.15234 Transcript_11673/m.15234 type:complete len:127 (-) Transcript_11673:8-388(-)|eukprot:CAMPEP_0116066816 /NCGR_PEP_ID=MMETSP0322-20121206/10622_1 /TAXON_ID=163516 /ORGANISM="Leptocylindrus danicus var. apora, Strain B651" /LENGTH=126 /DNA_ID=CAMNT_0003553471 /DNA_START=41 /DNA_END=421 /DNA_ORIENTATION=-